MAVILKTTRTGVPSYVTGADAAGNVTFSENEADALLFVDGTAATNFAAGKQVFNAVQVTVSGKRHYGKKSSNE